ncbi:MAG: signal peptidase I [Spirochaetota bacterium]
MSIFRRRSFTETVEGRRRFFAWTRLFLVVFLVFELVSHGLLSALEVRSASMTPTLLPGDRLLSSPLTLGPRSVFGRLPALSRPERGDLVLVYPPYEEVVGFLPSIADSLVRFTTFQRLSLLHRGPEAAISGPFVARVIALPGDEVSMEDFVFKVRPADSIHALTEFEFSTRRYDIKKPTLPEGWKSGYPLAGDMDSRLMSKDEYFVAADERGSASDSRTWGPIALRHFSARLLLRYWPFSRFGSL